MGVAMSTNRNDFQEWLWWLYDRCLDVMTLAIILGLMVLIVFGVWG